MIWLPIFGVAAFTLAAFVSALVVSARTRCEGTAAADQAWVNDR